MPGKGISAQYSPVQFKTLSASFSKLPVVDQMGVMMDASTGGGGLQPESDTLDLAMQVPMSASPGLWQMVAGNMGGSMTCSKATTSGSCVPQIRVGQTCAQI